MLAKLMKYELKATSRLFLPLFGAMIAMSLVNRLFQMVDSATALNMTTPRIVSIIISTVLFIATGVVALVIMIQRFNKNLLQNEGYLMLTLPVKIESLILSKLFVSSIWYVVSCVVVSISMVLAYSVNITMDGISNTIGSLFSLASGQDALISFETIAMAILGIFATVLLIYTCLALGMLANNHRGLVAFGAFFAISTILQITASIAIVLLAAWGFSATWSTFAFSQLILLGIIGMLLVLCIVFFFVTRHMLRYRLNLH